MTILSLLYKDDTAAAYLPVQQTRSNLLNLHPVLTLLLAPFWSPAKCSTMFTSELLTVSACHLALGMWRPVAFRVNQNSKVAGRKTKTIRWKVLKHSKELPVVSSTSFITLHMLIWSIVNMKILISAVLTKWVNGLNLTMHVRVLVKPNIHITSSSL